MPERNVIQAMFPQGSEPLHNPRGSAPGIWLEVARDEGPSPCLVAAMPGVPSEMKHMFQHEVLPRLPKSDQVIQHARVNIFGVGESQAEEMLGELTARGRDPEVGITVHEATITLRMTAHGKTPDECLDKFTETRTLINKIMGQYVFGVEDEELQDVLVQKLQRAGKTVSTAESGTGGLLAHRFTEVPGFEACFSGGVIAPTDKAKTELLDISESKLSQNGPVSSEIALAMAEGCRLRFKTDFGLAVTECPEFDPDHSHSSRPSAFVALVGDGIAECQELKLIGDPAIIKSRAAKMAMNLLRIELDKV
jgi:nicotinamide-nucleotide amidase